MLHANKDFHAAGNLTVRRRPGTYFIHTQLCPDWLYHWPTKNLFTQPTPISTGDQQEIFHDFPLMPRNISPNALEASKSDLARCFHRALVWIPQRGSVKFRASMLRTFPFQPASPSFKSCVHIFRTKHQHIHAWQRLEHTHDSWFHFGMLQQSASVIFPIHRIFDANNFTGHRLPKPPRYRAWKVDS